MLVVLGAALWPLLGHLGLLCAPGGRGDERPAADGDAADTGRADGGMGRQSLIGHSRAVLPIPGHEPPLAHIEDVARQVVSWQVTRHNRVNLPRQPLLFQGQPLAGHTDLEICFLEREAVHNTEINSRKRFCL